MRGIAASPRVVLLTALALLAVAAPAADAAAPSGRIVVKARFDESAGPYSPGSIPFVTVRNAAGRVIAERRIKSAGTVVPVKRGSYRITTYWRPCQGRCDPEDLPLDQCARRVSIHTAARGASETVSAKAVFKGGAPCRLAIASDWPPQVTVSTGKTKLAATRGPYCRPGCSLPPSQPSTKRRLPIRAGSVVRLDMKVPTRRLSLTGICGNGPLHNSKSGRFWTFRVPPETASSIGTCHDIKLTITYAGPGIRRGVVAVFGFDLRLGGS